jgi:hypothetical protein
MKSYIRYRAGPGILPLLRDEGLDPRRVRVFCAPAGGPKWFVSVGFDRALISGGFLTRGPGRVLLAGSSAGAWRCLAMACRTPPDAYERLRVSYSRNTFTARDTPLSVQEALRKNVSDFIEDRDIEYILGHPTYDVAVHTVRARGPAASRVQGVEGLGLAAAAILNAVSPAAIGALFERVVFFSGSREPAFIGNSFPGTGVRLVKENLRDAALATGCLPYFVTGVENIVGSPPGVFRDGGITDYQLNADYEPGPDGVTLFFHYQERIVPGWFDKPLRRRRPSPRMLHRVLQVYPGPDFIRLLPGGRLPDREDFRTFVDRPTERIRRWDEVSKVSAILGEEFADHVESGRIGSLAEPL